MRAKYSRYLWIGLGVLACNGDGGGPASPGNLSVAGTWTETSQIVSNPCGLELPGSLTGTFQLTQSGTQLTVVDDGEALGTGSLNLTTGDFTLSGTFTEDGVTVTIVQSGRFTSSTRYTAETILTVSDGAITCTIRTNDTGSR
ncbi:hypothetical protein BH20GEM1_BH20GEM1_03770 [soil metagenome]